MRHSLFARFLLIFALLFAQMGGLTHGISHALADQSQDQSAPHDKQCDLCAAYAQTGNALGSHAISFNAVEQPATPVTASFITLALATPFAAFAARAPPRSA